MNNYQSLQRDQSGQEKSRNIKNNKITGTENIHPLYNLVGTQSLCLLCTIYYKTIDKQAIKALRTVQMQLLKMRGCCHGSLLSVDRVLATECPSSVFSLEYFLGLMGCIPN